jgi:hypothetical protein
MDFDEDSSLEMEFDEDSSSEMEFGEDSSSEMEFDADSSSEMKFDYFVVRPFDDAAKKVDEILNNMLAQMKKATRQRSNNRVGDSLLGHIEEQIS